MKRLIKNIFAKENYHCFACSPHNPIGLHLQFYETERGVECEWVPQQQYESYPGIIHGGLQATMLDEIAAWTVYIKARTSGVTSRLNVKYRKPVSAQQSHITLQGEIHKIERGFCYVNTKLLDCEGDLKAEGEAIYRLIPLEQAIAQKWFPENYEDFFN
jgi:acyl-coenzyme A thioesterase PaaI-like protein